MLETLGIRRYRAGDLEAVRRLHEAALRDAGAFAECHEDELDRDLGGIERVYLENGGDFLVGVLDGRIVAMGGLKRAGPGRVEIKRMRVEPTHQRLGFGQVILRALEVRAAGLGYVTLHLDTGLRQEAARSFYEKNGYREVGCGSVGPVESVFYEKDVVG